MMDIEIVAHKTLQGFLNVCFRDAGCPEWTDEDVEKLEIGGEDENGVEYDMDISHLRAMKCYGMATPKSCRIDVWIEEDADLMTVFELIGHEVAHIYLEGLEGAEFGTSLGGFLKGIQAEDFVASEKAACVFGDITRQSAILIKEAYRQLGYPLELEVM
jgi:hypothetical protein